MQSINQWITTYLPLTSTIVVAIATVVLVLLTSRYVRFTGRILEETQKHREPLVTIDFELPNDSLRLVICNYGLSPAKNIQIEVIKDIQFRLINQQVLAEFGPIKDGVSYLTPARKLKYYLGFPKWENTPEDQLDISLYIKYENEAGKNYEHIVNFDFGQMREVLFESFKDSNLAIAEAIRDSERERRSRKTLNDLLFNPFTPLKMKKCTMCAERIPKDAKKCSHCLEMQESAEEYIPKDDLKLNKTEQKN